MKLGAFSTGNPRTASKNWTLQTSGLQKEAVLGEDSRFEEYFGNGLKPPTRITSWFCSFSCLRLPEYSS